MKLTVRGLPILELTLLTMIQSVNLSLSEKPDVEARAYLLECIRVLEVALNSLPKVEIEVSARLHAMLSAKRHAAGASLERS